MTIPDTFDAATTPFSLSLLTSTKPNASKKLIADHDGQPRSDPAHRLGITAGTIEHRQVAGLAGLRDLLQQVTTRQALVHGVHKGSAPGDLCALVTIATLAALTRQGAPRPANTITRSLDDIDYPAGVRLLMLDVDVYPGIVTPQSPHELLEQLTHIWPACTEAGWLATISTRSAIKDKQTHAWLTPPTGFHVYLLVTGDVARFRDLARVRLWLAGTGYCKLASPHAHTGVSAVLERCLIDLSVFSPERLDYVAGSIIAKDAPFYQDRPAPELHPGVVLDLDALPAVTDDDRRQAQTLVQAARLRVQPVREATVRAHIHQTRPTLDGDALAHEIAARLVQTDRGLLTPDHPLLFDQRRSPVTAATVTAALDGKRLADPFEPDYRDGTDAIFHWHGGRWLINSFAHGMLKTYRRADMTPEAPAPDPDEPPPEYDGIHTDGEIHDDPGDHPYVKKYGGFAIKREVSTMTGTFTTYDPLTNFTATITGEVTRDDGSGELRKSFEMEARLKKRVLHCAIPAKDFSGMNWVTQELGAQAIIEAGSGLKDHARAAIQHFSQQIVFRHIYEHTGWRRVDGVWCYLHGGGAITADGARTDLSVELAGALARYSLPPPPTEQPRIDAVHASLALRALLADNAMVPIQGLVYLAPLREFFGAEPPDFTVWVLGRSGLFKSELAALAQAHWGDFTRLTLPASFVATSNAIERLTFATKDALLVVDDYFPARNRRELDAMDQTAARLLRGAGNGGGRQRMRQDTSIRPDLPPRGVTLATGERLTEGQSTNARSFLLSLTPPADTDDVKTRLYQAQAQKGQLPAAMAAYIQWLAGQFETLQATLLPRFYKLRAAASAPGSHARQATQVAYLHLAWETFSRFAVEVGALSPDERMVLMQETWTMLTQAAQQHAVSLQEDAPERRFLALLADGFASKRAYLENLYGDAPADADSWGWLRVKHHDQEGHEYTAHDRPNQGTLIGHVDDDWLYLFPEQAYQFVAKAARDANSVFPVEIKTLLKHLGDTGSIAVVKTKTEIRRTIQMRIGSGRPYVIKLRLTALTGLSSEISEDKHVSETTEKTKKPTVPTNTYSENDWPVFSVFDNEKQERPTYTRDTHAYDASRNGECDVQRLANHSLDFREDREDTEDTPVNHGLDTNEKRVSDNFSSQKTQKTQKTSPLFSPPAENGWHCPACGSSNFQLGALSQTCDGCGRQEGALGYEEGDI